MTEPEREVRVEVRDETDEVRFAQGLTLDADPMFDNGYTVSLRQRKEPKRWRIIVEIKPRE